LDINLKVNKNWGGKGGINLVMAMVMRVGWFAIQSRVLTPQIPIFANWLFRARPIVLFPVTFSCSVCHANFTFSTQFPLIPSINLKGLLLAPGYFDN
jgi:hypothetical protein